MATRSLEVRQHEGIPTNEGVIYVEGGSEAKVFEVSKDAKLLIMVMKSDDVDERTLFSVRERLRQQLQKHGIDAMLFAIDTDDDFQIYEEK